MKTISRSTKRAQPKAAKERKNARIGKSPPVTCDTFKKTFEELFVEVACAEAADYDDIHRAIQREHREPCKAA